MLGVQSFLFRSNLYFDVICSTLCLRIPSSAELAVKEPYFQQKREVTSKTLAVRFAINKKLKLIFFLLACFVAVKSFFPEVKHFLQIYCLLRPAISWLFDISFYPCSVQSRPKQNYILVDQFGCFDLIL